MTQPLRVALAGLGTVGAGVVKVLSAHGDVIAKRAGRPIVIVAVSARSRTKDRGVDISGFRWEDDPVALAQADDVDVLVEVMGGEDGPAKAATAAALEAGKHVVSANKAMLATHGTDMAAKAEAAGVALRFEAAVAGGIPIVKALTEGLAANGITRVMGVMNGTCNYILTEMERTGADFKDVLSEAQAKGYAEADPTADVGGFDAAQKLALLTSIAFGTQVDYDGMSITGIERVSLDDIRAAGDMGYRIKLLGVATRVGDAVSASMEPCLVPATSPLGMLENVTNMVVVDGDFVGQTVYQGPGAGEGPTASAVVGDIIDIARGLILPPLGQPSAGLAAPRRANSRSAGVYYLRLLLADQPGTLAQVADALAAKGISIDRMRQTSHSGDTAPVLIVTHACAPIALGEALETIEALNICHAAPVAMRIEEV
ncbi:MAG: homoserine dehydrogenase [Pseudomonadota bacterium]